MPNAHITSDLPLTIDDAGAGRRVLVLHGGGGPATVAMIAGHLAQTMQVITPTLPGWNGTERPERIRGIDDLAVVFLQYLEDQDLTDALVIGSSIGGWIAAETSVRDGGRRISGLVLIDAVGIEVPGQPITDFFALDPRVSPSTRFTIPSASTSTRPLKPLNSWRRCRPTWPRCVWWPAIPTCTTHCYAAA
jgi:pimeloyl-ACP methyl ester carboxylesterase